MGNSNLRPQRPMDNRQFVSRREFNALQREVQRLSRLNVQSTAGGYLDMPGGRFIRALNKPDRKQYVMTYDSTAEVWTLKVDVLSSLETHNNSGFVSEQRQFVERTYKWNNTMTGGSDLNIVLLHYDMVQLRNNPSEHSITSPTWSIEQATNNEVTGFDTFTQDLQIPGLPDGSIGDYKRQLIRITLKEDGTFILETPGQIGPGPERKFVERPIEFRAVGALAAPLAFNYEGSSTRRLWISNIVVSNAVGVGGISNPNIIVPVSMDNEDIILQAGFNTGGFFAGNSLKIDTTEVTPLVQVTSEFSIGRISTDADGELLGISVTGSDFMPVTGKNEDIDVATGLTIDFVAETFDLTTTKIRFGHGSMVDIVP